MRIGRHIKASRALVYRALLDREAVAKWKLPDGMTCHVQGGTNLFAAHDGLPSGVSPVDNETGWQMALAKLAALVETRST